MSISEHKKPSMERIGCKIITISDTRTPITDKSGLLITKLLEEENHIIRDYIIIKDDQNSILSELQKGFGDSSIDIILTNGGTGISKRDVTIETVQKLIEKEIVGFGEIFRMLSYKEDIGSAAILSRAIAGVVSNTAIFSMPGSTGAVKLAMKKLILPEMNHIVNELYKQI